MLDDLKPCIVCGAPIDDADNTGHDDGCMVAKLEKRPFTVITNDLTAAEIVFDHVQATGPMAALDVMYQQRNPNREFDLTVVAVFDGHLTNMLP